MSALPRTSGPAIELGQGRFRVAEPIGHGGVGTVYRATDTRTGAEVAVKVLMPHLVGTKVEQRFLREGEALRRLAHPNVVRVHDIGRDGPYAWLVMDLMDRGTAHALVKQKGALPVHWCLHIAESVLGGLQAVHAAGWVHRDVKPGNILLDRGGNVKLSDFGILRDGGSDLTAPGVSLGTLAYMAPEQMVDAAAVTPSADLYALGATLFALSTGKTPKGLALRDRRQEGPWDLLPRPLRGIVRRACAWDPSDRFADAADMRRAVREVLVAVQRQEKAQRQDKAQREAP